MIKYFVIAGNYIQAQRWIEHNNNKLYPEYYPIIVTDASQLYGISDHKGIFLGTWAEREDLMDILQRLVMSTEDLNKKQMFVDLIKKIPNKKNHATV